MPTRLTHVLAAARADSRKAMGLFLTHGFPDVDSTLPLLRTLASSGADFIELGMPFSDPLAEGLPIQRSSERALRQGITMRQILDTARRFREESDVPLLLMGYINPVFRYGVEAFFRDAAAAGVDGIILPDLPPEELGLVERQATENGLDFVLLVAPNTGDERMEEIDRRARGFVYAVSVTGLTGSALDTLAPIEAYLERARARVTRNPLLVGFGIRSHADAVALSRHTDGFIVGSALIQTVERLWEDVSLSQQERQEAVAAFVRELKTGFPDVAADSP